MAERITLKINKAGINGEGIGFYKRKPVFVDGCYPGEMVVCELQDAGRHYEARLLKIIERSPQRIKPECAHFRHCGSCALMALEYEQQLQIKKQLIHDALYKYARIDLDIEVESSPKILHYRNKCNLPFFDHEGRLVNALYAKDSNHPVIIDDCPIHEEGVEEMRKQILSVLNRHSCKAYSRKERNGMRQLVIRGFADEYQAVIITGNDELPKDMVDDLGRIEKLTSLFQGINTSREPVRLMPEHLKKLFGPDRIILHGGHDLLISPQAFFQLNECQAERIYRDVRGLLNDENELIVEAYCGIGGISFHLADKAKQLIGVEIIPSAIRDANKNAKLNGVTNTEFICDDAAKAVRKIAAKRKVDVLVADPPRTGIDEQLLETIMRSNIRQIVYVSCNPSTLGKDLNILLDRYEIRSIKAYDMFPNTPHVETVCCLYHQKKDFISVPYEPKNVE